LSRAANLFARTLLRLRTRDVTGGFRLYDRDAIEVILEQGTECDGYGFQVEGVCAVTRSGMRVAEVPITFRDRAFGRSKMNGAIVWEATRRCIALAFEPSHARGETLPAYSEGASDGR
jgi:dolichol-phosphate mannosyltransferase